MWLVWSGLTHAGRAGTWMLTNGDRLTGELISEDPQFIVVQHPQLGRLQVPRTALQLPAEAGQKSGEAKAAVPQGSATVAKPVTVPKVPPWKRLLEVGYAQQSGAAESQNLLIRAEVDGRKGARTFRATGRLLQAEANGKTVTDRLEGDVRWRYDVSKRLFAQALTTYAEDRVRKIDLSLEQQFGGGYRILDAANHKANIGLGAVVQYLQREAMGEQTSLLGSLFQDYAYQWGSRLKLMQEANFMVSNMGSLNVKSGLINAPAGGSYRVKFNTGLQSKVTDSMSLNLRFEYDYDRSVLQETLRADQRLTTSLGYNW